MNKLQQLSIVTTFLISASAMAQVSNLRLTVDDIQVTEGGY